MTGTRIRQLRKEISMSQKTLSVRLGVTQESVSSYENGNNLPSVTVLIRLREIFGVSMEYLMGLTESRYGVNDQMSEDEAEMLSLYRMIDERGKEKVKAYICGYRDSFAD